MSSGKRRKLDSQASPQVSAISAISARRRLALPAVQSDSSSEEALKPKPNANSFEVLQDFKTQDETSKTPRKSVSRARSRHVEGSQNGSSAPPKDTTKNTKQVTEQQVRVYSSFQLAKHNHALTIHGVLKLRLKEGERFVLLGSFGIRVLDGEVKLAGATLRASGKIFWVHAPYCLALPVIRIAQDAGLEVYNDGNSGDLRRLGHLSPLHQGIWHEAATAAENVPSNRSFQFMGTSLDAPKRSVIQELSLLPEWNKALESFQTSTSPGPPLSVFICGPKSAGKSTFARLLTNRLLTRVLKDDEVVKPLAAAMLDLDPGQPEYSPPGTISLVRVSVPNFGAPFTHATFDDPGCTIMRCHSLASVSPASSPDLFVACAIDLFETYQRTLRDCPLVVNTPGWILGTGLDLLVELISKTRPKEIVYMSADGPTDVMETLQRAARCRFTALPSQPSEFTSRTAAHFRTMHMMSYFHSRLTANQTPYCSPIQWSAWPLTSMRPYAVQYRGETSGILGIISYDYQPSADLLVEAINGAILAIVEIEDDAAFNNVNSSPNDSPTVVRTRESLPFIANPNDAFLDPRFSRTIGLALIRGIDVKNHILQVLTPLPLSQLSAVHSQGQKLVLVLGSFDNPAWAYTEELHLKAYQHDSNDQNYNSCETAEAEYSLSDEDNTSDEGREEIMTTVSSQRNNGIVADTSSVPWIEILKGNQKRPMGSRAWRVRRDLGRSNIP